MERALLQWKSRKKIKDTVFSKILQLVNQNQDNKLKLQVLFKI